MNRTLSNGAKIALAFISVLSCSEHNVTGTDGISTDDIAADAARIATVGVTFGSSSIEVGQTTQATATVRDYQDRILVRVVTWSSSDNGVATVSPTGQVTGVAPGTALITASRAGKTGSGTITVTAIGASGVAPVASVSVALAAASLSPGQTTQATAIVYDSTNNVLTGRVVTWSSGNAAIATVSNAGVVTAVASGNTSITATSEGKSGSATLTVSAQTPPAAPVASVSVSPATGTLQTGGTVQFSAVTRDASGNVLTGRAVTWTSSNAVIASVSSSGLVTGVAVGTTTISATSEGVKGAATVTVSAPSPPSGGAPEPGSADVILWKDNFDRPTLAQLVSPYATRGTMELVSNGHSGQAIRFDYSGNSYDNLIERSFPVTTDIYFRFWYRSSPGADPSCGGQNDSGFKWFMAWRPDPEPRYTMSATNADGVPWQGRPNAGMEFTSHDNSSATEPAQFLSNINHDVRFSTTNEGNWHKYTLHIKVGTGGYEQIWVDDILVLDNSGYGYDHSATGISLVQFPGTMVRWFAGCDFTLDIDDFVIWHK